MSDSGESRLYGITGPDALPVFGRKVVESEQLLPVLVQIQRSLRVLGLIGFDKQIKGFLGIHFRTRLPDFM